MNPTTDEILRALSMLAGRMSRENDPRRYGVNCAWIVVEAMAQGENLDDAIARVRSVAAAEVKS